MDRISELNAIIETIHFENRHKYTIAVLPLTEGRAHLKVTRMLVCTSQHIPKEIHNSSNIWTGISDNEFIKKVFKAVGQFEAHEFVESFVVNEQHAYFPHDRGPEPMFRKSNDINKILLDSWDHIVKERSFLSIALIYFGLWFNNLWFNRKLDELTDSISDKLYSHYRTIRRLTRYAIATLQCLPIYIRISMKQKESYSIKK